MFSISIHLKTQTHIRDHGAGGGGGSLYQRSGIIRFSCGKCSLPYRQCSMVGGDQIILRYCNPALHFNNIKDLLQCCVFDLLQLQ